MAETESKVCSICLEPVDENADRAMAKLRCKHVFHLDCIGSQFNYRGEMACPNCRVVEHGQWLYSGIKSLQQQEERPEEEEQQQQQPPIQLLLKYIFEVFSNQQPEQLEQLINNIFSNIEDPQEHFHLVMPSGQYWCPNGGFQLHPSSPPPSSSALPVRRTGRVGRATDYLNQLRAGIGIGPTDRQVRRLNYERIILTHRNSGASQFAPYSVRQQHQPNNFPSPALGMSNLPTRQSSLENISPPRTRSHQQLHPGPVFQSQLTGSCPFFMRGR